MSSLPNYLHLRAEPQRITAARIKHLAVKGVQRPATCSLDEIKELCTTVMAHIAEMERRASGGAEQQTV